MYPNPSGTAAANNYLLQRIQGASPEQLAALLLEGGQKFILQATTAMRKRDIPTKARLINKVSCIIEELMVRLDHEEGGELATNLGRLYEWWLSEVFAASQKNEPERLERVSRQMGEIRSAWETFQPQAPSGAPALSAEGLVG